MAQSWNADSGTFVMTLSAWHVALWVARVPQREGWEREGGHATLCGMQWVNQVVGKWDLCLCRLVWAQATSHPHPIPSSSSSSSNFDLDSPHSLRWLRLRCVVLRMQNMTTFPAAVQHQSSDPKNERKRRRNRVTRKKRNSKNEKKRKKTQR